MQALPGPHAPNPTEQMNLLRDAIVGHRLNTRLHSAMAWRTLMEHHVFAVWDFMSLLKRLQRELTCVSTPWMPRRSAELARFVNALVLAEESDEDESREASSHFELYVRAMKVCGADTTAITQVLRDVAAGAPWAQALAESSAPPAARAFVTTTLDVVDNGCVEEVVGAFLWGREALIPPMFAPLLGCVAQQDKRFAPMHYYLQRHIELDGSDHGPKAQAMLDTVCGTPAQQLMARQAAVRVLHARLRLWDSIADNIDAAVDQGTSSHVACRHA